MANELYRTYEVLVEESIHLDHLKRAKDKTSKESKFKEEIDGALRDTHMIFQDAVCYNTLLFAGLAGNTETPDGDGIRQPLNPLWKHLTAPAKQGGINEETERVIRRLATHYKPLAGVTTAEEFLNHVYSEPLKIKPGMTGAQERAVRQMRAMCYRLLEMAGAPKKENGGQECADMSAFANTWAGLTSKPDSNTEIPGNGAYDRVSWELKANLTRAELFMAKKTPDGRASWDVRQEAAAEPGRKRAAKILEETLSAYSCRAETSNKADCEAAISGELDELKKALAEAESLPDSDGKKPKKLKKAKDAVEAFSEQKAAFEKEFFDNRKDGLARAIISAMSKPFVAQEASELGLTENEFEDAKQFVAKLTNSPEANAKPKIRLSYKGGRPSTFEGAMFRYWLLCDCGNQMVERVALADFLRFIAKDKPEPAPELDGVTFLEMPFKQNANIAFPLFGKMCLGIETIHSSPDWAFDKTAYATAAEDVFKYKIRTDVRKARVRKLLQVVHAYENDGNSFSAEDSPTGKTLVVRGMGNDPRWKGEGENRKGVTLLLKKLSEGKEIGGYGLREGTIGGWAEVRKMLLRRYKQCVGRPKRMAALPDWLQRGVDKEQTANRQGFGSADFFHALCDPDYYHLWLTGADYERHGVKDFIPHYVTYCEWREELVGLFIKEDGSELERETTLSAAEIEKLAKKPIRYTWPGLLNRHKKPSYRYYDFAGALSTAFQFKSLFRRIRVKGEDGKETHAIEKYIKLTGDAAKVTLAARRLKRDKIINKDTGNSVDALWCPPLILAGDQKPTAANHPRAGKYDDANKKTWLESKNAEVSFSLIASPRPGDVWIQFAGDSFVAASFAEPVHFTVSFKIEANALAALQNEGVHFASGSTKGVDEEDEKRKFLRWPVDIETDKQAAKEAAEKVKREDQKAGATVKKKATKKTDVLPDNLWCAWDGGFLVKESRYSKAEKTKRASGFHILSIDLGNRFAAAFTRQRIHADANGKGRVISADGFSPIIKAECIHSGKLCLQGEGAKVWDHVRNGDGTAKKNASGNYLYALEDETYGNGGRGRFPDPKLGEYEKFKALAARLVAVTSLSLAGTDKQTYPELGDHLVFRLKRRIGRLRTLFNLIWRLYAKHDRKQSTGTLGKERGDDDVLFHRRLIVETLARSAFPKRPRQSGEEEEPGDKNLRTELATEEQWQKLKDSGLLESLKGAVEKKRRADLEATLKDSAVWKWNDLGNAVKKQIQEYVEGIPNDAEHPPLHKLLVEVIEFCLPLRGRHWRWKYNPNGERLSWEDRDSSPDWNPNVMGMRGLSMKRLEQILNLRQRCQSFAKLEDRYYGRFKVGSYDPEESNRDERPDVCPLLLERSNRIREQRVDQTAHLILAEALGMELKNPAEVADKKVRKAEVDLHGEYKRRNDKSGMPYPRCSVIVLENLERYKMSLGRTKSENSRLMKWAHGKILDKLEDMCRPFGITLMLVDPAFSSHFDARTGLPGVRVNQVSLGFENEYPYNRWIEGKTKAGGETQLAKDIKLLAKAFAEHPEYKGELVLAVEGGKEFVPVLSLDGKDGLINADICAAGNIGHRGIADPQRWDIFPRLRTKQISETEVSVTNWRGWFGKFSQETKEKKSEQRRMRAVESAAAEQATASQKKNSKKAAVTSTNEGEAADSGDSQSGQSSEYPPFFVANPQHDWLPDGDWLKQKAFKFDQNGKSVLAYRQGEYLKRVEQICSERIKTINDGRIHKLSKA